MKSLHYFSLAVVAVLCLVIGYYVGAQGGSLPGAEMIASETAEMKADEKSAETDSEVLATVNGKNITSSDVQALYASLPAQYRQAPMEFIKDQLLQQMISMEVISQAAEAEKMGDQKEFKDRMDTVRNQLMQEFYITSKIDELVTDELLKEEYNKSVADFTPEEQLHAKHILLKTEEEANDMIKLLDDGGNFEELAKEYSTGPSGPNGGDLGYFTKGSMVPEFADAAFGLNPGEYTKTPVKTQFGYHVIKSEDKRSTEAPSFEEKEAELRSKASSSVIDKLLEELKADASIILMSPTEEEKAKEDGNKEESKTEETKTE
ncbi:peptidylprolyl isomerase [Sneathiella sp. HT1-7]|jgi:peptidyl-prolyl cis-trans isomerase C|uniref:peptidylprolyl isomerase n=1 Tax=Sneathiella sp. HT1-7 TaxID=2887192 RepID=UPI001D14A0E1|nr:peptidylprolyl isomerase [Sneathiella sp. HT1-7]MCC3303203.1 peptidylprolyl isomerase [Sneathiella sp. HT1-7]